MTFPADAQPHFELDALIPQRIPGLFVCFIRNQEFDSFDTQSHGHMSELGCLSHPGRRHKIDREWIDLVHDREGTFLGMKKLT